MCRWGFDAPVRQSPIAVRSTEVTTWRAKQEVEARFAAPAADANYNERDRNASGTSDSNKETPS